ncbi:MAG: APC family permease [Sporolactobacillus sp.]
MEQGKLKRKLSLLDLTMLGIGSIIGSGWLYASMKGANYAGSFAWLAWVIGAVAVILIGLVYGELGAAIPRTGGFVKYPDYSHGSVVGFMIGFISMLAYSSVAGVEVEAVRQYATYWWPALSTKSGAPTVTGFVIQAVLLVMFFFLNYWSVNVFGKINTVVTVFKFIVPTLAVITLLSFFHPGNFSVGHAAPGGISGVFQAVSNAGIVFAFLGFRQAVDFAGEAKNPKRDVPLAIIFAVTIGMIVYMMLQITFLGAVPAHDLASGWAKVTFNSPFANLAATLGVSWLTGLILFDAVISPAGTGNIYLSGTSRVLFAWAQNGYFYKIFQQVDKRSGVPRSAMWLTLILGILWTLPGQFQQWSGLISAVTSATVLTYMVGPISAAAFRKTLPGMERPFRLAGMSVFAPLAFISATLITYWSGWTVVSLLIGLTLISIILYFAFIDRDKEFAQSVHLKEEFRSAVWLFVYFGLLLVMSYLGTFKGDPTGIGFLGIPGGIGVIPAPVDTIVMAVVSLIPYVIGINTGLKHPRVRDQEESEAMNAEHAS